MTETATPLKTGPVSVWIRAGVLLLLIIGGFAIVRWTPVGDYVNEAALVGFLTEIRQIWWAPIALISLYALFAPLGITVVPLIVAGAVFGPLFGTLYNTTGLLIGALASFWLARTLGRSFVMQILGSRAARIERMADRHGFWPLVQTRFLPLPFPVVNFGAALAGVSPSRFAIASVLGLIPSTMIHSFFIANIMFVHGAERIWFGIGYGASFLVFNLLIGVPWWHGQRRRRDRYREIIVARTEREPSE